MSPGLHIISSGHRDRWRCGPLMEHREGARQRRGDRQRDGGRCTVRRTQIHGYSNSAVLSQSYWKAVHSAVNSALKLDIDPSILPPPPNPLWLWDSTFSLLVIPSLAFGPFLSLRLSLSHSWDSCHLCILASKTWILPLRTREELEETLQYSSPEWDILRFWDKHKVIA